VNLDGKTVLVTGSTDGVGRVVAKRLAERGAAVLVHGRDAGRGHTLVSEIRVRGGRAELILADLASLAEVRRLADEARQRTSRLAVLINNAGVGTVGTDRQLSVDGYELRFAVNYLAGFLLTALLLPLLRADAPSRIVNVASAGQQAIDFGNVMLTEGFTGVRAYCQSKLAQIISMVDLAHDLEGTGVTMNSLHPASYMDTTMVRLASVTPWSTVEEGAEAILNLATSPELEGRSGLYFNGLREARADAQAYDPEAQQRLRALSLRLTGLPPDFLTQSSSLA
jgi:NAD(P)-dependent dehydrogenase (short-subunit alcohol dehydrogenase family)